MNLADIISPETVKVPLNASEKREAINELVDLLGNAHLIKDVETTKTVVWEREQQRSTGIGEGLAIPHGKSNCSDRLLIALGRPATPIEFESVDHKPVSLIVLLISPPDKTADHIQALGKISRLMSDPGFRESAYTADTAQALYELFKRQEVAAEG